MLKHYVRILYPDSFMPEESVEEIKERKPELVKPHKLGGSLDAFCFYFFDRTELDVCGETLRGNECNQSKRFYLGGKTYTLFQMKKEHPELQTLISNMECNNWKHVIQCRTGNWQPFETGDVLIN